MNEEIWRPIEGYEGLYEVSNTGRVRSVDRYIKTCYEAYKLQKGKILNPGKNTNGYLQVVLHCNGKCKTINVHKLVAQAFLPNPDNLPMINHKDEDKTNNNVTNLERCDAKYNINYGTRNIRRRDTLIKNGSWTGLSKKEYNHKYYQDNRDKICEQQKKYDQENKDKIKDRQRSYNQENKEHIKEYKKRYYQENKDKISDRQRSYYQENKDKIKDRVKEYRRKKKEQIQNNA